MWNNTFLENKWSCAKYRTKSPHVNSPGDVYFRFSTDPLLSVNAMKKYHTNVWYHSPYSGKNLHVDLIMLGPMGTGVVSPSLPILKNQNVCWSFSHVTSIRKWFSQTAEGFWAWGSPYSLSQKRHDFYRRMSNLHAQRKSSPFKDMTQNCIHSTTTSTTSVITANIVTATIHKHFKLTRKKEEAIVQRLSHLHSRIYETKQHS